MSKATEAAGPCGSPLTEVLGPLYAKRDHVAQGEHYTRHVSAMTGEGLHSNSAIAAELAHRDMEITRLRRVLAVVREYPDFDNGGPLAEAMDQAMAGQEPPLLALLEKLVACGVEGPNARLTCPQGREGKYE